MWSRQIQSTLVKEKHWGSKNPDDGSFYLTNEIGDHNHLVNHAAILAEELKLGMVELVKKDPSAPV